MLMCSIAVGSRILTKRRQTNYLCAILRLPMLIDMELLFIKVKRNLNMINPFVIASSCVQLNLILSGFRRLDLFFTTTKNFVQFLKI